MENINNQQYKDHKKTEENLSKILKEQQARMLLYRKNEEILKEIYEMLN